MKAISDGIKAKTKWIIRRYKKGEDFQQGRSFKTSEIEGNLLLNEGIAELIDLLIGVTATAYNNANTRIGVGDSNTAASAEQTGLQAVTNKLWKGMESGYPANASQKVTFRSVFGSADANYSWQEFTVVNSADDAGDNLNRKVSDQGTKASGQTWTVDLEITFS